MAGSSHALGVLRRLFLWVFLPTPLGTACQISNFRVAIQTNSALSHGNPPNWTIWCGFTAEATAHTHTVWIKAHPLPGGVSLEVHPQSTRTRQVDSVSTLGDWKAKDGKEPGEKALFSSKQDERRLGSRATAYPPGRRCGNRVFLFVCLLFFGRCKNGQNGQKSVGKGLGGQGNFCVKKLIFFLHDGQLWAVLQFWSFFFGTKFDPRLWTRPPYSHSCTIQASKPHWVKLRPAGVETLRISRLLFVASSTRCQTQGSWWHRFGYGWRCAARMQRTLERQHPSRPKFLLVCVFFQIAWVPAFDFRKMFLYIFLFQNIELFDETENSLNASNIWIFSLQKNYISDDFFPKGIEQLHPSAGIFHGYDMKFVGNRRGPDCQITSEDNE